MPHLRCSIIINKDIEKVFEVVRNLEEYSRYVPDVESVKVIEDKGEVLKTVWISSINGKRIKWTEEIIIDLENRKAFFRQIEGDFRKYEGVWQLKETEKGVKIEVYAEFEFNIPLFGAFLNNYLVEKVKKNTEIMLKNIKKKAENG